MSLRIAIQMDPLSTIIPHHDTSFALMLSAQARGHHIYHFTPNTVAYNQGIVTAWVSELSNIQLDGTMTQAPVEHMALSQFDIILLRQDPPFDMAYITNTHLLELIADTTLVLNDPAEVRNAPEKLWVLDYAEFMPPTMIASDIRDIKLFRQEHKDIILKPLFGMGGKGVIRLKPEDGNLESYLEMYLDYNKEPLMAQAFLPEVAAGDRRVILIDGEYSGTLNRIPELGAVRANMAAGGQAASAKPSKRILEICEALKPELKERGLLLVGIDVIGNYLTEINVTSPTGLQEIERFDGTDLRNKFWDAAEELYHTLYKS